MVLQYLLCIGIPPALCVGMNFAAANNDTSTQIGTIKTPFSLKDMLAVLLWHYNKKKKMQILLLN